MYDASKLLSRFYEEKLRLGHAGRRKLASLRDTNLDRLKVGLEKLGPVAGARGTAFTSSLDQGSYAMHTLNQHPDGDYDIDTGVIFDAGTLPSSALDARKRVAQALLNSGVNFLRDPEARTNAVTVWYAEGHHVDLAVYRRTPTGLEHAGPEWTARNPSEMTEWFAQRVDTLSPYWLIDVDTKQLRRIVRFIKRFCASRRSWSLPGGMIATTLVTEVYVSDGSRDDLSLRRTLVALRDRIGMNERVFCPVDASNELTAKPKTAGQVRRLKKRLDEILPKLDVLDDPKCDEARARAAWNAVFRHDFFEAEPVAKEASSSVAVTVHLAQREGGPLRDKAYRASEPPLPKGLYLRFEVAHELKPRDVVRWIVRNEGDEAEAADQMGHTNEGRDLVTWRTTAYRGDHAMRCEIERGGRVIAAANRTVRVA
ncbi:MAG: cyclic GMP-AMP synthase DncV-like nucleotidyltransferase [Polyangiaceae bacterium]